MRLLQMILLRLPAPLIAGTLWFLSSQTTLPQPPGLLGWDKLQHFIAYGILGFAIGLWISPPTWKQRPRLALLLTTLAGSIYGAIDEIHQYFVPGRHSSILDWAANTMGAFTGALVLMLILWKYRQIKANASVKTQKYPVENIQ